MSNEVILASVPSNQATWPELSSKTAGLALAAKFELPELKIGTLDALMTLSDELAKADTFAQGVATKLALSVQDLAAETGAAAALGVNDVGVEGYLGNFHWDTAKFNTAVPIKDIARDINKRISEIETEMKTKLTAYSKLKGTLSALDRKANGSLLVRSLGDVVKPSMFVLDSEYLITLCVVVPKQHSQEWENTYETLNECVVPRSTVKVTEDMEHALYTVTLFRRVVDDFKARAREHKFTVRDYEYKAADAQEAARERTELKDDIDRKYALLVKAANINFGEVFSSWMHVKALRLFVESVLRFGLPVTFKAFILRPKAGKGKALRQVLNDLYAHHDTTGGPISDADVPTSLGLGHLEFYPYVSLQFDGSPFFPAPRA